MTWYDLFSSQKQHDNNNNDDSSSSKSETEYKVERRKHSVEYHIIYFYSMS